MVEPRDGRIVVLHLITRMVCGGAQRNTLDTVLALDPSRYRSILATGPSEGPEGSMVGEAQRAGADIRLIRHLERDMRPASDVRAVAEILTLIRRERPDIVHTHTSKAGVLGRVAARAARVPVVIHTPHGHVFQGYGGHMAGWFYAIAERLCAPLADRLVMLTEQERRDHLARRIAAPARFTTIHSGVDLAPYSHATRGRARLREDLGIPADAPLAVAVGRLVPVKGHRYLIAAMPAVLRRCPDAHLVLVGSGPDERALLNLAAEAGVCERVHMAGHRADVADCLAECDVLALPSLNEGMGRVVVEAMAARVPVVASAVSGVLDLVRPGETGILVPPADADALADGLGFLLASPGARGRLAKRAAEEIAPRYSLDSMLGKLDQMYRELVGFGAVQPSATPVGTT